MEEEKLFNVKRTQLEMVYDRGYELSSAEEELLKRNNYDYFVLYIKKAKKTENKKTTRGVLNKIYTHRVDGSKLLVYYATRSHNKKKISNDSVKKFTKTIEVNKISQGIFIYNGDLSSSAKSDLQADQIIGNHSVDIQIFQEKELYCNAVKHVLTPEHVLLSKEEGEKVLSELKLPPLANLSLPLMLTTDPVVKYYNWKAGSMVKIYRNDDVGVLTPKTIGYRTIIKATMEN